MKYVYYILLMVGVMTGIAGGALAQVPLGMTTSSVSSSTPALNSQLSVLTELKNYSTTDTFTGIINFLLANKDSIHTDLSIVGMPNYAGTTITLAPLQQRTALFTVQLSSAYFAVGPDIIIVWPVATAIRVVDSARAPITITVASGILDVAADGIISFVSDDQLAIRCAGTNNAIKQVQIFDLTGRVLAGYTVADSSAMIPLHELPKGMYIAEILCSDGESKIVKFIR